MFEIIRTYQLDIMLALSATCFCFGLLLFITKFLDKRRKEILIFMEFDATFLLFFDRMAYIYSGDVSVEGYIWVRVSNFFVFFLTAGTVFGFNLYLQDLLIKEGKLKKIPKRLMFVSFATLIQGAMLIISQFTGWFYYFDEYNVYHRGAGFVFCYIIPILCPLIQFSIVQQYRGTFSKYIYIALVMYIYLPIFTAIVQLFAYGISIVNMAMVLVSISLYVFTYLDVNETVLNAHKNEMKLLKEEKSSFMKLLDQTASAFMSAVEQRDEFSEGHSQRVARLARRVGEMMGKSEEECDEIYYASLLHNVGLVSIPDDILDKKEALSDEERKVIERVPVLSSEILSGISEHPYFMEAALYSHEHYDGTGYPLRLKGKTIPEVARIVGACDSFDEMTTKRSYRGALPLQTIREEMIRQAGVKLDPDIAAIMVKIVDQESELNQSYTALDVEKEINCTDYRKKISVGIPVIQEISKIRFKVEELGTMEGQFSAPAIVLFDSFDGYVHETERAIKAYHYLEYGELWFDGRVISTSAKNIKVDPLVNNQPDANIDYYEIKEAKYEDHIKLQLISPKGMVNAIVALPDRSKAAFIGLTGENCRLYDIEVVVSDEKIREDQIERIVEQESYINRMESDLANIQINQYRSAHTTPVAVKDKLKIEFHTMSLPSASLVWHCPYIVLYYSDDKTVNGPNYKEYAMLKINGEISADEEFAENRFSMKKLDEFPGWDAWKELHKAGLECSVLVARRGKNVILNTENLGISIENTTIIKEPPEEVYICLTGDEIALTDIRISN